MKISTQVLIITGFAFALGFITIFFFYDVGFKEEMKFIAKAKSEKLTEQFFHHQEEVDVFLQAVMDVVSHDELALEYFNSGKRDELYKHYEKLFQRFRTEYGITHFYFIRPDGTVFLRMHEKLAYGDKLDSPEFLRAQKTGKSSKGFSAGRNGFAARSVLPYYFNGKMYGYIELGQDSLYFLEHVLDQLGKTGAVGIVIGKDQVSKNVWNERYKSKAGGFEWSTFDHYVAVSIDGPREMFSKCAKEKDFDYYLTDTKGEIKYVKLDGKSICAGYPLYDAIEKDKQGLVVMYADLTDDTAGMSRLAKSMLVGLVLPFVLSAFLLWLLVRASIAAPVKQLAVVAGKMASGDFRERVEITTDDEISDLAKVMNAMAAQLEVYKTNMELLVDMRTEELRHANDETIASGEQLKLAFEQLEKQTRDLEDAYKELEKVNTELKGLERIKTEFLQTISHELRSPLTPILGYLELMRDGDIGQFNDTQKEILQEMFMCARNLQLILDELLEAASIQAGRIFLDISQVDMKEVLKEAGNNMKKFADESAITITNVFPKGLLFVEGDRRRLYEIAAHLLRNAVKFSHRGGTVVVTADTHDDGVEFMIKDEGIGISPDRLNKIFEAFYQIDSSSARFYEGVGLGLFLVRKLVDIHHGKIRVQSEESKGTTFTVFIPRVYKKV